MLILLLMVLWPIAELFVAIQVADAIGVLLTVLALIASWPVGTRLLRAEGRAAFRRFRETVAAGRPGAGEAADGALVLLGGVLLIVPGFITDVLGLGLLLAPVRRLARGPLVRGLRSRFVVGAAAHMPGRRGTPYDVDSTAKDVDRPQLHG